MKPYFETELGVLYHGDCLSVLKALPDESVNCCVTSPPYWGLRDYGVDGQLGLEKTPEEYIEKMVEIFRDVKRVLKDDGTVWLNLGDSYNGSGGAGGDYNPGGLKDGQPKYGRKFTAELKPKDLVGIPWRVALALQADGWYLRQDIIWAKPNPMPESVNDRCTKAHEYIFLLSKNKKYYCDMEAIKEKASFPGDNRGARTDNRRGTECNSMNGETGDTRNKRSVWTINTKPFSGAHFAVFPEKLIEPCILAGCPKGGVVLDPFMGSGTTAIVAYKHGRKFIGIELNDKYLENITIPRIENETAQLKLFK